MLGPSLRMQKKLEYPPVDPDNQGLFFVFSGAEIRPHSQWNSVDFFPHFEKKVPMLKKKNLSSNFHLVTTDKQAATITSYFSFSLMTIVCKIVIIFLLINLNMCFGCPKEPSH